MNSSLLEVLISFTLLLFVILGVSASNLYSMRSTEASYNLAVAIQKMNNQDDYLQQR